MTSMFSIDFKFSIYVRIKFSYYTCMQSDGIYILCIQTCIGSKINLRLKKISISLIQIEILFSVDVINTLFDVFKASRINAFVCSIINNRTDIKACQRLSSYISIQSYVDLRYQKQWE